MLKDAGCLCLRVEYECGLAVAQRVHKARGERLEERWTLRVQELVRRRQADRSGHVESIVLILGW